MALGEKLGELMEEVAELQRAPKREDPAAERECTGDPAPYGWICRICGIQWTSTGVPPRGIEAGREPLVAKTIGGAVSGVLPGANVPERAIVVVLRKGELGVT